MERKFLDRAYGLLIAAIFAMAVAAKSPAPSSDEQHRVIEQTREIALNYTQSLPDFICTETVHRYSNERGPWRLKDVLTAKLTYTPRGEDYELVAINGQPSKRSWDEIAGARSQGEFGSLLQAVFGPKSETVFKWDRWTTVRDRPVYAFTFQIAAEHSVYVLNSGNLPGGNGEVQVGQRGVVLIDRDSKQVLRVVAEATDLPRNFAVRGVTTELDYNFADIGGKQYLLPLRAVVNMNARTLKIRNEVEFEEYRKFAADATIQYGR